MIPSPVMPQTVSSRQGQILFPKKPLSPSKSCFNQSFQPCRAQRGVVKEAQAALLLSPLPSTLCLASSSLLIHTPPPPPHHSTFQACLVNV